MRGASKSIIAAAGVLAISGALVFGALSRDHVETGSIGVPSVNLEGLVASNSKSPELQESDFFYQLTQLLEREYVDPVQEDDKLSTGAVRGMIASLQDPDCMFMNDKQFRLFMDSQKGVFAGIGAEYRFQFTPAQLADIAKKDDRKDPALLIPNLVVSFVAPGGPADKAGIKPGDQIETVNGRWVLASGPIKAFREQQQKVAQGKLPAKALDEARTLMRDKLKDGMTPGRAREILMDGESGKVELRYLRAGLATKVEVAKQKTEVRAVEQKPDGSYAVKFFSSVGSELKPILESKSDIVLDLRDSGAGNFEAMKETLGLLGPAGTYGEMATEKKESPKPMTVVSGSNSNRKVTLIVDGTTRGAAEIFALALSSKGVAKLQGQTMGGDRKVIQIVTLPGGSGYTLATGIYRPSRKLEAKQS